MNRIVDRAFDPWSALADFARARSPAAGAIASFVGVVRDVDEERRVDALNLEHYPEMADKQLAALEREAAVRWPIEASLIIHRVGRMTVGEPIVLVAAASAHRAAALQACQFLIDWLKTRAPIWKFEESAAGTRWIEAKRSDDEASEAWL